MNSLRFSTILAFGALVSLCPGQDKRAVSGLGGPDVGYLIKISSVEKSWVDLHVMRVLIESSAILDRAAEKVGLAPGQATVRLSGSGLKERTTEEDGKLTVMTSLSVYMGDGEEAKAEALFAAVVERLEAVLAREAEVDRRRANSMVENAHREVAEASDELERLYARGQDMRTKAKRTNLSLERIEVEIEGLEAQQREIELELAGQQARRKAIEAQIAKAGEQAQKPSDADRIRLNVLEERYDLAGLEFAAIKKLHDAAETPESNVLSARMKLIEAEGELKLQHAAIQERQSQGLDRLNEELITLSIDTAEAEARLKVIGERLAGLQSGDLLRLAHDYEKWVASRLPRARERLERVRDRQVEAEERLARLATPKITVLGGE